ncbi:MAG: NTP transferase domain-containing protein [Planctomycetes bacterium]|nr:NTP transferase domain-containing protein [Planctomycetota bacterium]
MSPPPIVVLAGGASTRLRECKALADLGGGLTPLAHLCAAGAELVVGGAHAREIRAALPAGVEFAHNAEWESGRLSSVRCAVRARPGRDLCLAPVDVPLVPAGVFVSLAQAWEAAGAPERGWLAPCVGSGPARRHGHPVVLGRTLLRELLEGPPERTLKSFRTRAQPLLEIEVQVHEVLDDLDTPEDLARLRARRGF